MVKKKYLFGLLFLSLLSLILFNKVHFLVPATLYSFTPLEDTLSQGDEQVASNGARGKGDMTLPSISPKVGQWLLYKVELRNSSTKEATSFTVKISLVSQETIDKQIYFWEELDMPSLGVILKRLSNLTTGEVKKCIFQRRGDQPVEFDITELSRQLDKPEDMLAKLLPVPSLSFFPEITEPTYRMVSRKKTSYSLAQSHKKLECLRTNYEDLTQTLKLCIWTSINIPITNVVKSEVTTKELSTSITLLDFGLTGATSRITAQSVKFGVTK